MEEYWMRYKSEGVAKGLSMQVFCSVQGILYNSFGKYLKLRRHFSIKHKVQGCLSKTTTHCPTY